jgi:hypothetical protein
MRPVAQAEGHDSPGLSNIVTVAIGLDGDVIPHDEQVLG